MTDADRIADLEAKLDKAREALDGVLRYCAEFSEEFLGSHTLGNVRDHCSKVLAGIEEGGDG